jgi:hypothetical protein
MALKSCSGGLAEWAGISRISVPRLWIAAFPESDFTARPLHWTALTPAFLEALSVNIGSYSAGKPALASPVEHEGCVAALMLRRP